jgi:hypothetical protein
MLSYLQLVIKWKYLLAYCYNRHCETNCTQATTRVLKPFPLEAMLIIPNPDIPVVVVSSFWNKWGKSCITWELHSLPSLFYLLYTRDVPMYIKLQREFQLGIILKLLHIYEKGSTFKLGSGGIPIGNRGWKCKWWAQLTWRAIGGLNTAW